MGDWLLSIARWLEVHVLGLPIYLAAPAMIIIGALDSSLLSLPEINDYLVVGRCFKEPTAVYYFPLFAAMGSVLGCNVLYTIVRRRYCRRRCRSRYSWPLRARSSIRAGSFCSR
jgi:membrane protein YqaA with SNARE-associated domain